MPIKIFIDQGHNPTGVNVGAQGFGLNEGDVTYNVGTYLAQLLNANPNFEARTSRTSPDQILGTSTATSLAARVSAANSWPADYFLSIHANANVNPAVNGTEMYVYRLNSEGAYLGQDLLRAITERVGTKNNGVRANPGLYVLRRTRMPAVLAELAYLTNAADAEKLANEQYEFAYALYEGLLRYFGLAS